MTFRKLYPLVGDLMKELGAGSETEMSSMGLIAQRRKATSSPQPAPSQFKLPAKDHSKFGVAKSVNRRSTPIGLAKVDLSRQLGGSGEERASSVEALLPRRPKFATKSDHEEERYE